jgi:flagellar biosynthesis anti-sigma factor FlgM
VARVEDVAAQQPDVRADRVAALRTQIANGTYTTDTNALAAQLLG